VTPSTPSPPDPAAPHHAFAHIFIDRSLGAVQVPALLRGAGFVLTTMQEHYGEGRAQRVTDIEWITMIAENGWIAFHKDAAIRRNEAERRTVQATGARMFVVPRADLTAAELAGRFIENRHAIARAVQKPGPCIYSVQGSRIVKLL
jgi:hypothetical protein